MTIYMHTHSGSNSLSEVHSGLVAVYNNCKFTQQIIL